MDNNVIAIDYEVKSVGKTIKSSKKRLLWNISIDNIKYFIELFLSKFSGKKTIKINGEVKYRGKKITHEPIVITGSNTILLKHSGKLYDLYINNVAFEKYLNTQNFSTHPRIIISSSATWEDKAKPYKLNKASFSVKRETLPIKVKIKPFNDKPFNDKLLNIFDDPFAKPRSSSRKSDPGMPTFTDLLN
jgi:hypothetical protein